MDQFRWDDDDDPPDKPEVKPTVPLDNTAWVTCVPVGMSKNEEFRVFRVQTLDDKLVPVDNNVLIALLVAVVASRRNDVAFHDSLEKAGLKIQWPEEVSS